MTEAAKTLSAIRYAQDPYDAVKSADALVILTEWDQFRALDLSRLYAAMATPRMIDLRNIYRADNIKAHGFDYTSIGRPHV